MEIGRTLANGADVMTFSAPEFLACVDYAVSDKDLSYPVDLLGVTDKKIDDNALDGYNALIDIDAFKIDDDGYPLLTETNETIISLISSMSSSSLILDIRLNLNRRRQSFYVLHGDTSWSIIWKSKDTYKVITDIDKIDIASSFFENINSVIRKRTVDRVSLTFSYYNTANKVVASTQLVSDDDGGFMEKKPNGVLLTSNASHWPAIYDYAGFIQRMNELLRAA
jgi:hypothetical protein